MRLKLSYWKTLPWCLAGIGGDNVERARDAARSSIRRFEETLSGEHHLMTKRFLDPNFEGGLRGQLEDWLGGVEWGSPSIQELQEWVGALKLMRCSERQTEAQHKIISTVIKSGPSSSEAYVSTELRQGLVKYLWTNPSDLAAAAEEFAVISSGKGSSHTLAKFIGGPLCNPCKVLTDKEQKDSCFFVSLFQMLCVFDKQSRAIKINDK